MKILFLNKDYILKAISMKEVIEEDEKAFVITSDKNANIPLRTNVDIKKYKGQVLYMPGYLPEEEISGQKIISIYPENINKNLPSAPSTMILLDAQTGFVKAIIDGTILTRLRTGAMSGVASKYLSRKDSKIFLLIGTGGQAQAQLEAVLTVRQIEEVYVSDTNFKRAQEFSFEMQEKFKDKFNVKIMPVKSPNDIVPKADIITTVTTSKIPSFDGKLIKKGTHINSIGSYTPDAQETPVEVLKKSSKIYFDSYDAVLSESGDVIIPINKGEFSKDKITGEIGQLIKGNKKPRENDDEITWFKAVGTAVLDLVVGEKIYKKAIKNNIGEYLEF